MSTEELLRSVGELFEKAGARSVYGEPIPAEGKIIVPVATLRYGFGAGSGRPRLKVKTHRWEVWRVMGTQNR